jgi:hypothetical protein
MLALAEFLSNEEFLMAVSDCVDSRLSDCLTSAARFLVKNQLRCGEFRSYSARDEALRDTCELEGSPFVTTFVLYALELLDDPGLGGMKRRAQEFLIHEMEPQGLWKYWTSKSPRKIDPDLDDTACASFALRQVHPDIQAGRNIDIILRNRNSEGLFFTWLPRPGDGYNDVDSVVNANVMLYLGEREETMNVCDYLNAVIGENRESGSYNYYLDDLALYYAVSRAYFNGVRSLGASQDTVISRTTARRRDDGSFGNELSTALAICSLLNYHCDQMDLINPAVEKIIDTQRPDGSWPKRAFYAEPPPPPDKRWYGSEELTTALCIEALAHYRRRFRPSERPLTHLKK